MSIMLYVSALLMIGLLFLIIFIYRIIYKQNMNRALEGRATTGLIEIGPLLKTLTFIALIIMNIVLLTRVDDLTYQLRNVESNLVNQISSIRNEISGLRSTTDAYYQSLELVQRRDHELKSIDLANEMYTYDLSFTLLELEDPNAEVYLVIDHNGTTEKQLITSETLTFTTEVELEYSTEKYEIDVLLEGTSIIQEEVLNIYVDRDASNIISFRTDIGDNEENILVYTYVYEEVNLVDGVEVSEVTFKLYQEGELVKTQRVTETTSLGSLLNQYDNYSYWEYDEAMKINDVFAIVYELDGFYELEIEYVITLSDGTVITRDGEGF